MRRIIAPFATALLFCAAAQGIDTKLTVNATATIGATGVSATGTATLDNIGSGSFTATLSLTPNASGNLTAPFTITLSGGTITGTLTIPPSVLAGSANGSASITGGTGSYSGATGSFPQLAGTGSVGQTGAITLTFSGSGTITIGGGGGGGGTTPTITAVLDAGSYTNDLAQGSIFVVKGSNLSASGYTPLNLPYPQSANGVKITFTPAAGGTGTDAYLVYLYNQNGVNQLAAILPSTLAVGRYNVTVTSNSQTSAGFATSVVQRKAGLITQASDGSGLASVQNYMSQTQVDLNRYTTNNLPGVTSSPAHPGQYLIAWATGLGPVSGADNNTPTLHDLTDEANIRVLVGGVSLKPAYAGRSGYPGEDQINFTLPADIATGCAVSLQVSVGGKLSNAAYIAIAPGSAASCVMQGFTPEQLKIFDANPGTKYTTGAFSLLSISQTVQGQNQKFDTASGAFTQYTANQLANLAQAQAQYVAQDGCYVFQSQSGQVTVPTGNATALDAGTVTLNGPSGSNITNVALDQRNNLYSKTFTSFLPGQPSSGTIVAGTYTLNGAGGKDVGKFGPVSITIGTPLTIAGGLPATVNRGADLKLSWTGGNPSDLVEILGSSSTGTGTNTQTTAFVCTTTAGKGGFPVPTSILQQLPASTQGSLAVYSSVVPTTFSAPLTAGGNIDQGFFVALTGTGALTNYQ